MKTMRRRAFLRVLARSVAGLAAFGRIGPVPAAAPGTPRVAEAFEADAFEAAMIALFGQRDLPPATGFAIDVAEPVEDGAIVPMTLRMPAGAGVDEIFVLATRNPVPLVARFQFPAGIAGEFRTRIKLAETSTVVVVVRTDEHLAAVRRDVEVAIGGCSVMT